MGPLKVLMVTSTLPRWQGDSAPFFVLDLAEWLSMRGVEITILAPHTKRARIYEKIGNITIRRFYYFFPVSLERLAYGGGILPNLKSSILARIELPFFLLSQFLYVFWIVKAEKIDIVHSHWLLPQGLIAAAVRKLIKFRHIVTAHAGMMARQNILSAKIIRFIINHTDAITTNSQWNAKLLSRFSKKQINIIPMGVDPDRFIPLNRREELRSNLSGESLLVLGVGRWVEVKGYKYLIMAMGKVVKKANVKLVLIGFGPEEMRLKNLAKEFGLMDKITFIKGIGRDKINTYFASSDIFVLPSISQRDGSTEGFGLSLVEAMASGAAVIGSRAGGIVDIIKDGDTGLLAEEKNPDSLAEKILLLAGDFVLRKRLGERGMNYVRENYTWDKIAEKMYNVYQKKFEQSGLTV